MTPFLSVCWLGASTSRHYLCHTVHYSFAPPPPGACMQLQTLEWLEELQHEVDIRLYDLDDTTLSKAGTRFLALEVSFLMCVCTSRKQTCMHA